METADLIKDINSLMKSKGEADSSETPSLEDQIAATIRAQAEQPTEPPAEAPAKPAPKPAVKTSSAPAESTSSSANDVLLEPLKNGALAGEVMKEVLLKHAGPTAKLDDGTDNPKRALYERAIRNGGDELIPAAYARATSGLSLDSSSEKNPTGSFLMNSHPRGKEFAETARKVEKANRLFNNEQHEEAFLEAEEALLSTDVKLYWYRLLPLMDLMLYHFQKDIREGIPGKLGEDVRRCAGLPYASGKAYRSGVFCALLFTALMLFVLWLPPLRDFLVNTIEPDHLLHVCVVIIVILFFIAGWGGAIAGVIIFGLLGGGIEHFFGEEALATTLIILIYLVVEGILFWIAKSTGYEKVKRHKKHKKINRQRAKMRKTLEPQLRQRLEKLDEIQNATKLDADSTPEVLYWTSITNVPNAEDNRRNFRNALSKLRDLYQSALNSL